MNSDEIKNEENATGRRKFVWGASVLSMMAIVAGVLKLPFLSRKKILAGNTESKTKMVKMLTEDGRLVEIDEALLTESRKKLTNSELQNWIKK
jgi:heme exporter protein D